MIVTRLEECSKAKKRVYLDEEFAFVLYKGELRSYHIKEGESLDDEIYQKIIAEILPKRAKLRCMNLLKSRSYTRAKLKEKLMKGEYPDAIAEQALDYVASFHYLDDEQYAVDYINCYAVSRSARRIEQDLRGKGISGELFKKAWDRWEIEGNSQDVTKQIRKLIEKKKRSQKETIDSTELRKVQMKLFVFLARKGFSSEDIRKAMKQDSDMDDWDNG